MNDSDTVLTNQATKNTVMILDSNKDRSDIHKVESNTTQINHKERKLLIRLINEIEDFLIAHWVNRTLRLWISSASHTSSH